MSEQRTPAELCHEIEGEVREVASWLSGGQLSSEQFRAAVLTIEANKVKRFGFSLSAQEAVAGKTKFSLRFADTGELCATMEFDPATHELAVDHVCT